MWRLLAVGTLALGVIVGTDAFLSHRDSPSVNRPWALAKPVFGPASFPEALAEVDAQIEGKRALVARFPDDWDRHEALALAEMARFRLTGDYDDLVRAQRSVAKGMALAEPPSGPALAYAEIGLASHRLSQVEAALALFRQWVAPERDERAEAAALAGDVAFYRGAPDTALAHYREAAAIDPRGMAMRFAIIDKMGGDFDAASEQVRVYLDEQKRPSPQSVANVAMQLGAIELARGDADAARRRFEEADRAFPGHWLIKAHLAQSAALAGDAKRAIASMRAIAKRTGNAEVMDALAMLLRTFGDPTESRAWAARAGEAWSRRIAQAPEAAYGHAVEHELVFGTPSRALELAQRNLAARPYGEARILLAHALLQNGRNAAALAQLTLAEKSGWRSAPLYALRAQILELEGNGSAAADARKEALALNRRVFDPETALVWFSHG